jgi:hypothetical protein
MKNYFKNRFEVPNFQSKPEQVASSKAKIVTNNFIFSLIGLISLDKLIMNLLQVTPYIGKRLIKNIVSR